MTDTFEKPLKSFQILDRKIGDGEKSYIIAEISANHNQSIDNAIALIDAAKFAGADAVKLQTYLPETLTVKSNLPHFKISGTIWEGKYLFDLYAEAYMPWEWQPILFAKAKEAGLHCFSSAFDITSVDFLESIETPAYKIASFEIVDIPLLKRVALTGKPVIMSTGMATLQEIQEAVDTIIDGGNEQISLLVTNSGYPAPYKEMNLNRIMYLKRRFGLPIGLSDHTLGYEVPMIATAMGASIIEKHICLDKSIPSPDSKFSLEPEEFKSMVEKVRLAEVVMGSIDFLPLKSEESSRALRKSLFFVADIKRGDIISRDMVDSRRPGNGIHTRNLDSVIGRTATRNIVRGEPVSFDDFK